MKATKEFRGLLIGIASDCGLCLTLDRRLLVLAAGTEEKRGEEDPDREGAMMISVYIYLETWNYSLAVK